MLLRQQASSGGTGAQSAGRMLSWPPVPIQLLLNRRLLGLLLKSQSPCPCEILVGDAVYPAQLGCPVPHHAGQELLAGMWTGLG